MTVKKQYILTAYLLLLVFFMSSTEVAWAFPDTRDHWARAHTDYMKSRALISGYPDGMFRPQAAISRAEFITVLVNAIHKGDQAKQMGNADAFFVDTADSWAKGYIEVARELSIASGDGMRFHPQANISREEAVVLLVKALRSDDKLDISNSDILEKFNDREKISDWAKDAVAYALDRGIVSGFPDDSFRPKQNLSRAEVTVLFGNFLDARGEKFHFFGTLVDLNLSIRQVTFIIDGKEEKFEFADNVLVYSEGGHEPLSELNIPAETYFNLDSRGKVNYFLKSEQSNRGKVNIATNALNTGSLKGNTNSTWADAGEVRSGEEFFAGQNAIYNDKVLLELEEESKWISMNDEDAIRAAGIDNFQNNPGRSLEITRKEIGVDDLVWETGATGVGQLVAVIDSGIDAGHPDLLKTKEGYPKVIDFIDLTSEGRVELTAVRPLDNYIEFDKKRIDLIRIPNLALDYRVGYLKSDIFPRAFSEGLKVDKYMVLVTASRYYDQYDTVYIDTKGNGDFNQVIGLKRFSEGYQTSSIAGEGDRQLNLLVTEVDKTGRFVRLGFDGLGHGTHVAGIVAANGKIEGVASGAQLLAIKVMDRSGMSNLSRVKAALRMAADRGAHVAVVSMGQYGMSREEQKSLANLAETLWDEKGMLIVMAAGNNGPGVNTVAESAAIPRILSVGAYASPEMWHYDYGWDIAKPTLWYFSSSGPGSDGSAVPLMVAPGNAVSTYPMWHDWSYRLDEGSSVAAPHVAGAAALLLQAVSNKLYHNDSRPVWMSLMAGAKPLDDYEPYEQGFGALNLMRSWSEIKQQRQAPLSYQVSQFSPEYGMGQGLYARGLQPGELGFSIKNTSDKNAHLSIGGLASWIQPEQYSLQVPAGSERRINITYGDFEEPGIYSAFLVADQSRTPGWDAVALQTIIIPFRLAGMDNNRFFTQDELPAGQIKRYFFEVPEGAANFNLVLNVADGKGRARMHIVSPTGDHEISDYAGAGDLQRVDNVIKSYYNPIPGIWEVVVYSSATLSTLELKKSEYSLRAALEKLTPVVKAPDRRYLISSYPATYREGEKSMIGLFFWNPNTKEPANGVVSIDGRLHEIRNGLVRVEREVENNIVNLNIAW